MTTLREASDRPDDRYRCPRCCDTMHVRFIRSHEAVCAWIERYGVEILVRNPGRG